LYPEFDPKKPIAPDESWSFSFNDIGRYSFHDHLSANSVGLVVVSKSGIRESRVTSLDIHACSQFSEYAKKRQCWDEQLQQAMKDGGVQGGFAYFNALYKTEPGVPKECHGWSHTLGKAGYMYYKEHGDIELDSSASACGFGFYHSFLAELLKDTGDLSLAREFCEKAGASVIGIETSCKHGVGHGASSMFSEDPEFFGNFEATVDKATSICKKIYVTDADRNECFDGVFNEIYQNILNNRYGYSYQGYVPKNDPYLKCQTQQDEYRRSCYVNVAGLFGDIFDNDVRKALQYVLTHTYDLQNNGREIVARIAADRIQTTIVDTVHTDSIEACDMLPPFLHKTCFDGILNGFIQHGEPGNMHKKGFAFCREFATTNTSKEAECYDSLLLQLASVYTKSQMQEACSGAVPVKKMTSKSCGTYW
jgi:hypothetical protein